MASASARSEQAAPHEGDSSALRAAAVCVAFPTVVHTLLFDLVQGTPRFLAAAQSPPNADALSIADRVRASLAMLGSETGRQLLQDGNLITPRHPSGDGVDLLVMTGLPLQPFTACIVPLDDDPTLPHLLRNALQRAPTAVAHAPANSSSPTLRAWLREHRPDVLVMTSSTVTPPHLDACREGIYELIGYAMPPALGLVIAPDAVQRALADEFGATLELIGVDPSVYPPPAIATAIAKEMRERYRQAARSQLAPLTSFPPPIIDLLEAIERAASFIYRRTNTPTLVVSATAGLSIALAAEGHLRLRYWADRDMSAEALAFLTESASEITRWLPWSMRSDELTEWVLNRTVRPAAQLIDERDRAIAAAGIRVLLQHALHDLDTPPPLPVQLICCDPALYALGPALATLTLLDSCQPAPAGGRVTLAFDDVYALPALGALAAIAPAYAAAALEEDGLLPLAECLVLNEPLSQPGTLAVRGQLVQGQARRQFSLPQGSLLRLPLDGTEPVTLSLQPAPGLTAPLPTLSEPLTPPWPALGVILDARGRPIPLATEPEQRRTQLASWLTDVTAGESEA
ncbi:MAG: hypothetical protein IRY86_07940 [Thermorudis peleae]|nr:hypothetical protein [Thermorudis peleae]